MTWPVERLGDLCVDTLQRDPRAAPDAIFSYVDIASIDREKKQIGKTSSLRGEDAPSRARKHIATDDVLVATVRPNLNAVALVPEVLNDEIASTAFCVLRTRRNELLPRFVFYFCQTSQFIDQLLLQVRGAQYPAVSDSDVKSVRIPKPPLYEQRRIVEVLDEADRLRKLRADADGKAERILPALFIKMFGDPAENPRRWRPRRFGDLTERFSDGPFGSNLKTEHYTASGIRVVRLQNVGIGRFIDSDKTYVSPEHFQVLIRHECLPGDVIAATLGDPNIRACVLPTSIDRALNKADCVQIRPTRSLATAEYICSLLNSPGFLRMAGGRIHGQTRSRISMGLLREIMVPQPPVELQREFAQLWRTAGEVREKSETASAKVSKLWGSLLTRAFVDNSAILAGTEA
jgi:type I restriction enzyme S subunit